MIGIYRMVNQPYEYEAGMAHLTVGILGVLYMNFHASKSLIASNIGSISDRTYISRERRGLFWGKPARKPLEAAALCDRRKRDISSMVLSGVAQLEWAL
jgi:hypothetical protein